MIIDNCNKTGNVEICDFDNIKVTPSNLKQQDYFNKTDYFKNKNVLQCDKNNSSRTCPVLICNLKKKNKIFERCFPDNRQDIVMDQRPSFKVCKGYRTFDSNCKQFRINNNKTTIEEFNNKQCGLIPGKGTAKQFLENIDIESDLKNIPIKKNKRRNINVPFMFVKEKLLELEQKTCQPRLISNIWTKAKRKYKCPDRGPNYYKPHMRSWVNARRVGTIKNEVNVPELPSCLCKDVKLIH
tara:strand:+ start:3239 stop:3958 length:720 start_codon:yes stop_codon:yes gene_type:complete